MQKMCMLCFLGWMLVAGYSLRAQELPSEVAIDSSQPLDGVTPHVPDTLLNAASEPPPMPPGRGLARRRLCRVVITWDASPSPNVSGYLIRKYIPETGQLVDMAQLASDVLRFADRRSRRGETYLYRIYARDAAWRLGEALEVSHRR